MPIIRISAAETHGSALPELDYVTDIGRLIVHLVVKGYAIDQCPPDELIDITPPYMYDQPIHYLLQTEKRDPPEEATVHFMPRLPDTTVVTVNLNGTLTRTPAQSIAIPKDSFAVPIATPLPKQNTMLLHELVTPMSNSLIEALGKLRIER